MTEAVMPESIPPVFAPVPMEGSLAKFLSRPVRVSSVNFNGTTEIAPFAEWVYNPSVAKKLDNYRFMRGTLHVEFQYNASPFNYGRMIAAYFPEQRKRPSDLRQLSNCPHVLIDPSTNVVGKFKIPFISPEQWIDLTDGTYLEESYGSIYCWNISQLQSFSDSAFNQDMEIEVYCWMEEMELAYPTRMTVSAQQAGKKSRRSKPNMGLVSRGATNEPSGGDEYETNPNAGLISKPAAAIAAVAARLTDVPMIGPFATATSIGAGALSKVAALFGYSRPKDLTNTHRFVGEVTANMPQTDMADGAIPMTVTSKAELSIDPRIFGIGIEEDELAVSSIAGKKTFIRSLTWTSAQAADVSLVQIPIGVTSHCSRDYNPGGEILLTACGFAALPFRKWTGGIEVTVQVVGTKFHRGRLRFEWTNGVAATGDETNLTYNHVVDISDTKEWVLKFPYVGLQGYKDIGLLQPTSMQVFDEALHTGRLNVYIQNPLAADDAEIKTVDLLFWIRGMPDLTFADPYNNMIGYVTDVPPVNPVALLKSDVPVFSERRFPKEADTTLATDNTLVCEEIVFYDSPRNDNLDLVYFGDPIRSFRALMKRYTKVAALGIEVGATIDANQLMIARLNFPMYPPMRGNQEVTSWTDNTTAPGTPVGTNLTTNHLATYLASAFHAKRGSFRWIVDMNVAKNFDVTNFQASRVYEPAPFGGAKFAHRYGVAGYTTGVHLACYTDFTFNNDIVGYNSYPSHAGCQVFPSVKGGARIHIELPFYSPLRFVRDLGEVLFDRWEGENSGQVDYTGHVDAFGEEEIPFNSSAMLYAAAGEDFTMSFFIGAPKLYYYNMLDPGVVDPLYRTQLV